MSSFGTGVSRKTVCKCLCEICSEPRWSTFGIQTLQLPLAAVASAAGTRAPWEFWAKRIDPLHVLAGDRKGK